MIDLHGHILPGVDDGAGNVSVSLAMARLQVEQGVVAMACTPHILPGVYHNEGPAIRKAVARLQQVLDAEGVALTLLTGADNHVVPDFVERLRSGRLLSLNDTRYVLVEPPHNIAPARLDDLVFGILLADYVPVITHPERLRWIEERYDLILKLAQSGAWMQITSGSYKGRFGRRPKYWAERMTCEGLVHILASDAHDTVSRPPDLASGARAAERLVGAAEAKRMVSTRPRDMVMDTAANECAPIEVNLRDEADKGAGTNGRAGAREGTARASGSPIAGWLRRLFVR